MKTDNKFKMFVSSFIEGYKDFIETLTPPAYLLGEFCGFLSIVLVIFGFFVLMIKLDDESKAEVKFELKINSNTNKPLVLEK